MSPLDLIPAPWRLEAEAALLFAALATAGVCGGLVMHWKDGKALADEKAAFVQAQAKALHDAVDARDAAIAQRDKLASQLALIDADHSETLRRFNRANDSLAAGADAGTVRVRVIGATCPAAHDVPQAATGGRVDPGASAELGPDARRRYFALRGTLGAVQQQLAACQAALGCITGQSACPAH